MTEWWSGLQADWLGLALAAAAGFLGGTIWRTSHFRNRLLLVSIQLEAKRDEILALRTSLRHLRAERAAGVPKPATRRDSLEAALGAEICGLPILQPQWPERVRFSPGRR